MTDKQTATVLFRFEEGKALLNTQTLNVGESRIEVPSRSTESRSRCASTRRT